MLLLLFAVRNVIKSSSKKFFFLHFMRRILSILLRQVSLVLPEKKGILSWLNLKIQFKRIELKFISKEWNPNSTQRLIF